MKTITGKIAKVSVVTDQPTPVPPPALHEAMERPAHLQGATYKIKTPLSDHALYITINDIVIDGNLRPYELFINSKAMSDFQWIVALTRIVSSVLRKGGEYHFLIEELKSVVNPNGGYFKKGVWMPSLVAEIGEVFESHLIQRGLLAPKNSVVLKDIPEVVKPKGSQCPNCGAFSLIKTEGCEKCLECSFSRCG